MLQTISTLDKNDTSIYSKQTGYDTRSFYKWITGWNSEFSF